MKRTRDSARPVFSAFMTIVVASLLGSACLSIGATDAYDLTVDGIHASYDAPKWDDRTLANLDERIHVLLSSTHRPTPSHGVAAYTPDGQVQVEHTMSTPPDTTRAIFLASGAIVFASFGLFVLWWGRDRASLWLGTFCVAFGTPMVQFFGALPAAGMLVASLVDSLLEILAFFALYSLAEAVADASLAPRDPVRRALEITRWIAGIAVGVTALALIARVLLPIAGELEPDTMARIGAYVGGFAQVFVLTLAPLAVLLLAVVRATDGGARNRAAIILTTTACGLLGVIYSIASELQQREFPHFDSWWFTLVVIPVGFIITISTYRVVEVRFIVNRILVLTGMTLIIGAAITASETWLEGTAEKTVAHIFGKSAPAETLAPRDGLSLTIDFIIACAIVLSFSTLHRVVDEVAKRIVFRRRDEGVAALREFAVHRASFVTARAALLEQAVALVHESVGAQSAAIYQECAGGYERAASHGEWPWPSIVSIDDSAFIALRSDAEQVDLGALSALESALGSEGVAVRMAIGGRVTGALVVMPRGEDGDGPYVREERDAFDEISRGVADALFALRSNETTSFVRAVADGTLTGVEAVRRARALCDCDVPVAPVSAAAAAPSALPAGAGSNGPVRVETVRSSESV